MGKILAMNPMSFESGPGIRVEITLPLNSEEGIELTPNQLVDRIRKFRPYFGPNGGGVTFKGENIFNQTKYLKEVFEICHKANITTCIETNGNNYNYDENIFNKLDLIILNINGLPFYNYKNIDNQYIVNTNKLLDKTKEKNINIWIKQEIEKGINDNMEYIDKLKKFINIYPNIKNIELININIDENKFLQLKEKIGEV